MQSTLIKAGREEASLCLHYQATPLPHLDLPRGRHLHGAAGEALGQVNGGGGEREREGGESKHHMPLLLIVR